MYHLVTIILTILCFALKNCCNKITETQNICSFLCFRRGDCPILLPEHNPDQTLTPPERSILYYILISYINCRGGLLWPVGIFSRNQYLTENFYINGSTERKWKQLHSYFSFHTFSIIFYVRILFMNNLLN